MCVHCDSPGSGLQWIHHFLVFFGHVIFDALLQLFVGAGPYALRLLRLNFVEACCNVHATFVEPGLVHPDQAASHMHVFTITVYIAPTQVRWFRSYTVSENLVLRRYTLVQTLF